MKFLKKMTFNQKKWIFEAYIAGMAFFIGAILLSQTYLEVAIILGILTTFVSEPLIRNFKYGNKSEKRSKGRFRFLKNFIKALVISTLIMILYQYIMPILIEPISFGILYKTFDSLLQMIRNKIKG